MTVTPLAIPEVLLLSLRLFVDERGHFLETYHQDKLQDLGVPPLIQDNESCSRRGVVRGLHYQRAPYAQGKLVRVTRGAAWDVAVDIRRRSPTFGRWVATELSADKQTALWIPPGFAHGFMALHDDTVLSYKCSNLYAPEAEGGIRWDDPTLGIAWPLTAVVVSPKDAALPLWAEASL